ncbi:MAG: group 1 glycosyl transferase, partial [bacterium]
AIAEQIINLLDNDTNRHTIRKKAYTFCREAIWKEISRRYLEVFSEVKLERTRCPRPRHLYVENIKSITNFELPEMKFDHLRILTDDTGIFQHATYTIPNRDHGYCIDDNARALMVADMVRKHLSTAGIGFDSLSSHYLSFLLHAFNVETGRFRDFMTYARQWAEEVGSEDAHGRVLWSLGKAVALLDDSGQLLMSTTLFNQVLKAVERFFSPRAIAFALVGIHAYLDKFSGDSEVRRVREILANRLFNQFRNNATESWPWLENSLNYDNGKLPHALLLSVPIGSNGWYEQGGPKARFDQQPIEANAMIEACVEAFNITRDKTWFDNAVMCFNWFLGHNDLNMPLYDPKTGGCRDGLMADGINQNEGAESTLAWLLSLMTLQKLYADEILKQSSSPNQLVRVKD